MHFGNSETCSTSSSLTNIVEYAESNIGHSLSIRNSKIAYSTQFGPLDLVSVYKSCGAKKDELSTIHLTAGVNTSSAACIATYITDLHSSISNSKQSWFPSKQEQQHVTRILYCCYAPISQVDVRVEAKIPGSVKACTVNQYGQRQFVSSLIWNEIWVFSVLRLFHLMKESTRISPVDILVRRMVPFINESVENEFLAICQQFLSQSWVAELLYESYCLMGRIEKISKFFVQLNDLQFKCYEIDARFASKDLNGIFESVFEAVEKCSVKKVSTAKLFESEMKFLQSQQNYDALIEVAEFALKLNANNSKCWLLYIQALLNKKQYSLALSALNNIPYSESVSEIIDYSQLSEITITCTNISKHCQPEMCKEKDVDEFLMTNSSYYLKYKDEFLRDAYKILASIYNEIGWNMLLEVRGEVFVMLDEVSENSSLQKSECEKWLDDLFQVLYEDIKIVSIWKAEINTAKDRNIEYERKAKEWEIIGVVLMNLHQIEDSIYALQSSLEVQFQVAVARNLAAIFLSQCRLTNYILVMIRIIENQRKFYKNSNVESEIYSIKEAVKVFGNDQIISLIKSITSNQFVHDTFMYALSK